MRTAAAAVTMLPPDASYTQQTLRQAEEGAQVMKAAVAFSMVLVLAGGLGSADQSLVVNHPSSPVSLKSSGPRELEVINICDCGISRIRLGCVGQDGAIEHEFQNREMKLSPNEKQSRIAKDGDLEEIALCVRLGSQLSVVEVLADDGGLWHLTPEGGAPIDIN